MMKIDAHQHDHFAKPPIKEKQMGAWADEFAAAAQHPNVYSNVSRLYTVAAADTWNADDLKPYIDYALGPFGAGCVG